MRKNIIDKCREYHITSLHHITRSSHHKISHHITSQEKKHHNNSKGVVVNLNHGEAFYAATVIGG